MKNFKYIYIIAGLFWLASCKTDIHIPTPSHGSADFSKYIAVGNSLTAGFADGGLYREGQLVSYPSIIAKQMQAVGGGQFAQPLFSADQADGSGHLELKGFNTDGTPILAVNKTHHAKRGTIFIPGFGTDTLYTKYQGDINNYGVPGIKLKQITFAPYGNLNGFYERLLPADAPNNTTAYLDFITAKPFTFFSNWLGNNDALGYALSGGAGDVLTDKNVFNQLYALLIGKLTAGGQKGVVATIPDVTVTPYLNTVTVGAIVAGVQKVNPAVKGIYINAAVDAAATTYAPRLATANDLIVFNFPTGKIGQPVITPFGALPYGLTPYTPIDNQYVLDQNEAALTRDYTNSYNNTITSIAAAKGLAVFDAYTYLRKFTQQGLIVDGVSVSARYISGGIFSLDGVHLTPRGYAIVANEFIKAINAKYGSTISQVNIADYNGVKFP